MKKSIFLSMFLSLGVAFVFTGCTADEAETIVESLTQNSAPTANTQTITVAQDSSDNNITLSGSDIDEDTLTYTLETNTTHGTLSGTAPHLQYTPTQGYDGNDSLTFKVNDGTVDSDIVSVNIVVNPPENELPVPNAGVDQNITEGDEVTFDASSSTDDGTIESYIWNEGTTLLNSTVSFTKTDFGVGTHTITLTVTDNQGATATDEVVIIVNAVINEAPTANGGADQTITEGESVTLDASASSDDGTIESYIWSDGATLLSTAISFTKTDFTLGTNTITLTVTDNLGATATDEVVIVVNEPANEVPTAQAGEDQTIIEGDSVTLDASSSTDDGSIESYIWNEGTTLLSTDISFTKTDFTLGTHTITLTVVDNLGATATDEVVIVVNEPANEVPTAQAGEDQTITDGDSVTLDAIASTDDGTIESYIWNEGTTLLSTVMSFTKTDFTVGTHTITLTVTDNQGATATDEVVIIVNEAPIANAGEDQTITEGDSVTLDASSSTDDGTIESYIWSEGDIQLSTAMSFTKTDFAVGTHTITLTVTDNLGATATDEVVVTIIFTSFLKTGQTTSYVIYDDGIYQTGATRSYSRDNTNNIVTDNTTGLVWQDDTTSAAMIWDDALTYCSNLTLGGFIDWRLPSRKELVSLSDYGRYGPAIDPVFQNTLSSDYWSSTTNASYTSSAWYVYFSNGTQDRSNKTVNYYVRCVRAGQ